ncbi:MAG: AMP-binding protein, partial [Rubrivivax sp.]
MLQQAAARYGDRRAVVDGGLTLSYAALRDQVDEAARALLALGVAFGERVALWAPNLHEWIIAASAVPAVGGVLVPITTRMKGAEAADILARSGAVRLFCAGSFLGQDYPALLDGLR